MTEPAKLEVGRTYFSVFFIDEELLRPVVETLVYLGPDVIDIQDGAVPGHLFQYASSYYSDGNWNEMTDAERREFSEPPVLAFEDANREPIMDLAGLIEVLSQWQKRMDRPA